MLQEQDRTNTVSLKSFYRRRAARILPAYWVYLAVVAVVGWLKVIPIHFGGDILRPLTFTLGLSCWPSTIAWQTAHTWSLTIEEQFYLLWPGLFVLAGRRWRWIFITAVIISGPLARWWIYQHPRQSNLSWTLVANADLLAWGCLLAMARARHPRRVQQLVAWRPSLGRLAAVAVIQFAPWYFHEAFIKKFPPLSTNVLAYSAQAAATAYLIASLTERRSGILYRLLNLPVMVGIGLISYSLYLWQQLFLDAGDHGYVWNQWPIDISGVFAAALLSYFLIERPIRGWVNKPAKSSSYLSHPAL